MAFRKPKDKDKNKNKRLAENIIRIKINRLVNNTPVEVINVDAEIARDQNNNPIIVNEDNSIKEEFPGLYDGLVSDVLYKLESQGMSLEKQKEKVDEQIKKQGVLIQKEDGGYVKDGENNSKKINIQTEKNKLRLLKCVKFYLENNKGEGYYETIEKDGTRCISYLVRDGELYPYWHKLPTSSGEPVILVPDVNQRKKFYKEASEEAINDFKDSQDTFFKGLFGIISKLTLLAFFIVLVVWTVHNARWSGELYDESLEPKIQQLQAENEKIRLLCSSQVANQIQNNEALIDYAKHKLDEEQEQEQTNADKNNINI